MWRWDQGRLLYFQFDVLKKIANVLNRFDNADISDCETLFRNTLVSKTGMPFLPNNYTVKRNYSRVFQCSMLATFANKNLVVTDVCKNLLDDTKTMGTVDDYLYNYIPRFRFPFPAFDNYNTTDTRIYPFCAIIKFLISRREIGVEAKVNLDEIFTIICVKSREACSKKR